MTLLKTVLDLAFQIIGASIQRLSAQIEIIRWRRRILRSLNDRRRS